jgi:hypothetical protein
LVAPKGINITGWDYSSTTNKVYDSILPKLEINIPDRLFNLVAYAYAVA